MLEALKHSPEPRHLVEAATKYLRGVKGNLVRRKVKEAEKRDGVALAGNPNGAPSAPASLAWHTPNTIAPTRDLAHAHGMGMNGQRTTVTNGNDMATLEDRIRNEVGAAIGR